MGFKDSEKRFSLSEISCALDLVGDIKDTWKVSVPFRSFLFFYLEENEIKKKSGGVLK